MPKEEKGKIRKLGIPTVVDRVIQQVITQVLSPIFEKQFSEYSYIFISNTMVPIKIWKNYIRRIHGVSLYSL
ncbi:hypothetical protein [Clostridium oryzae]|uniref:Uncharacterized protein n=1 Tax=Clostridium oryzae TaxID=1450648 RepID=A0A1V4IIY6_9CLOT|nr:hypothetical protein CLORY_30640 [Clostridium oryzae]